MVWTGQVSSNSLKTCCDNELIEILLIRAMMIDQTLMYFSTRQFFMVKSSYPSSEKTSIFVS
jgi:hypothetical protein